jgi:DNA-binding XRE family transcriptional regulator
LNSAGTFVSFGRRYAKVYAHRPYQTVYGGLMERRSSLSVYRFATGMTQAELATKAGITREALVALEQGRHRPRRLTAEALAAVLEVSPDLLFPADTDERALREERGVAT